MDRTAPWVIVALLALAGGAAARGEEVCTVRGALYATDDGVPVVRAPLPSSLEGAVKDDLVDGYVRGLPEELRTALAELGETAGHHLAVTGRPGPLRIGETGFVYDLHAEPFEARPGETLTGRLVRGRLGLVLEVGERRVYLLGADGHLDGARGDRITVRGRPIVELASHGVDDYLFVVGYRGEATFRTPLRARLARSVIQPRPVGFVAEGARFWVDTTARPPQGIRLRPLPYLRVRGLVGAPRRAGWIWGDHVAPVDESAEGEAAAESEAEGGLQGAVKRTGG